MRMVAFVSDIHSNLEALLAVLQEVDGMEMFCLGDIVGYGGDPNEVVEKVRGRVAGAVLGNHDSAVTTGEVGRFNARAAVAAKWTSDSLTPENKAYLKALPRELRVEFEGLKGYLAHGSPDDNLWEYVDPSSHQDLFDFYLDRLGVGLVGLGHTHAPYVWSGKKGTVFNPGSVGQPRDRDPRASFAVATFDGGGAAIEIHRVGYDYQTAASKILAAGLPASLAERLSAGM